MNEQKWHSVIRKILNNEKLSRNDIDLMYLLMAMQILRTPEILDWTTKNIKKMDNELDENTARRYAIIKNLAINENSTPNDSELLKILLIFEPKYFVIYKSKATFILNSDKPVLCFSNNYISKCNIKMQILFFQFHPIHVLHLTNKRHKKLYNEYFCFLYIYFKLFNMQSRRKIFVL